jgi:UDP-2,3-diacylglucosamine hydrolase
LYFASDFHLGAPSTEESIQREKRIIKWIESIEESAEAIFLVGDIFDFWFEYRHVVPKGCIRLLGKIAQLTDSGIPVYTFPGNHDMWVLDYLEKEAGIIHIKDALALTCHGKEFLIHHGDGLGPYDKKYNLLKKLFTNKIGQFLFRLLHPDIGVWVAKKWSRYSRSQNHKKDETFQGEREWLIQYIQKQEKRVDYYIFGHRHLPMEITIGHSLYLNLGEWIQHFTYAAFDGKDVTLKSFNSSPKIHRLEIK